VNSTLSLSVCYLWNVVAKECPTHTRWFIWYEVHVYDVCPIEPGRRAPAGWGEKLLVRKAVNMGSGPTVIGSPVTRNLPGRRSRIFFSFYLV